MKETKIFYDIHTKITLHIVTACSINGHFCVNIAKSHLSCAVEQMFGGCSNRSQYTKYILTWWISNVLEVINLFRTHRLRTGFSELDCCVECELLDIILSLWPSVLSQYLGILHGAATAEIDCSYYDPLPPLGCLTDAAGSCTTSKTGCIEHR